MTTLQQASDTALAEFRMKVGKRDLGVVHQRALVSWLDEQTYLSEDAKQYGLVLWPSAIALALEIAARADEFRGRTVLELGAGVGLPGIVAAAVGATVVQTDRDEEALGLCRRNAERNGLSTTTRLADWSQWAEDGRYDWVIGSDVLYRLSLHDQLEAIFESARARGARVLVSDPLRSSSMILLERMAGRGWSVRMSRWAIGEGEAGRAVGVFDLER